MELEALLTAVRKHYLTGYREALASYREAYTPSGPEVLFEVSRDAAPVYRYYRADLASGAVSPPDITEVNLESHLAFEPATVELDGLEVHVSPIAWNGLELRVAPAFSDDAAVQAWGLKWIDPQEGAEADSDGLGAYVHSITAPESDGEATAFSVDFGSAPVSSLLELLYTLRESGARTVELHSRTVFE